VSQDEHDKLINEISAAKNHLALLQDEFAELEVRRSQNEGLSKLYDDAKKELEIIQARNEELSALHEELSEKYDAEKSQLETLQTQHEELISQYDALNRDYGELNKQSDNATVARTELTEKNIEQVLFDLINQEREENGVDEILWGKYLYKWATHNSINMATNHRIEYADFSASWQEIDWATGYDTAEELAEATLLIWQNDREYERKFLSIAANYGAIAVHKSGEVYYITYISSYYE
jgi:uncharacterized protein (DUF3084 family)